MSQHFHQLLVDHLPRMRNFARMLTRDWPNADDLVQRTAVLILKAEHLFESGTNFPAWANRIMKNDHISACRSNRRPLISLDEFADYDLPKEACVSSATQEDHVMARETMRAVGQLGKASRDILAAVGVRELSYGEAASELGCAEGTIKSRVWRARRQINRLLAVSSCDSKPPAKVGPYARPSTWAAAL